MLSHFLAGTGTEVDYRLGSTISSLAQASADFQTVNHLVQGEIAAQLKDGDTRVRLSPGQLPTVEFASKASDLYWGFRGTQGLTVSGGGSRENGRYVGTLTYVIRDSYGFPVDDTLDGFGPPLRRLPACRGAPHPRPARVSLHAQARELAQHGRDRDRRDGASALTAESPTSRPLVPRSTAGSTAKSTRARESTGCSPPTRPEPKWRAPIPIPRSKSRHNHCAEELGHQAAIFHDPPRRH